MVKTVVAASEAGRRDLATKTDLDQLGDRLEARFDALAAKFDAAVNRMLLNQLVVSGLLFAALKLC